MAAKDEKRFEVKIGGVKITENILGGGSKDYYTDEGPVIYHDVPESVMLAIEDRLVALRSQLLADGLEAFKKKKGA